MPDPGAVFLGPGAWGDLDHPDWDREKVLAGGNPPAGGGSQAPRALAPFLHAWVSGWHYEPGQIVETPNGGLAMALVVHDAGTYANDLAANRWREIGSNAGGASANDPISFLNFYSLSVDTGTGLFTWDVDSSGQPNVGDLVTLDSDHATFYVMDDAEITVWVNASMEGDSPGTYGQISINVNPVGSFDFPTPFDNTVNAEKTFVCPGGSFITITGSTDSPNPSYSGYVAITAKPATYSTATPVAIPPLGSPPAYLPFVDNFDRSDRPLAGDSGWFESVAGQVASLAIRSNQLVVPAGAAVAAGSKPLLHTRQGSDPNWATAIVDSTRSATTGKSSLVVCSDQTYQHAIQMDFTAAGDPNPDYLTVTLVKAGTTHVLHPADLTFDGTWNAWATSATETITARYNDTTKVLNLVQGVTLIAHVDVGAAWTAAFGDTVPALATMPYFGLISNAGVGVDTFENFHTN